MTQNSSDLRLFQVSNSQRSQSKGIDSYIKAFSTQLFSILDQLSSRLLCQLIKFNFWNQYYELYCSTVLYFVSYPSRLIFFTLLHAAYSILFWFYTIVQLLSLLPIALLRNISSSARFKLSNF